MNKIKIIYDAAKKMKEKDFIKGVLKAEGLKNQNMFFSLNTSFEKNTQTNQTKGKSLLEADYDGKKMKIENTIDCEGNGYSRHHQFMKHMHKCHNHEIHQAGFKERLGHLTTLLGLLSSIKLSEKEIGLKVISLDSFDFPEDIKKCLEEKMKYGCKHHEHMTENDQHHILMKEFHSIENAVFNLKVFINREDELEKITFTVTGNQSNEKNQTQEMQLSADLSFEW